MRFRDWAAAILLCAAMAAEGADKKARAPELPIKAPHGLLEGAASAVVSCTDSKARIRCTLDGSEPSLTNGFDYSGAIQVTNTTVIRATAFSEARAVTPVVSHGCLFLNSVLRQSQQQPALPRTWDGVPAPYQMDARVVNDARYRDRLKGALCSLPLLSIVAAPADLFGARGIYVNSMEHGAGWERPCSVEMTLTNGATAFHVNCGIRIQGNQNRVPMKSPKHSFRLVFKESHGAAKLHYPVFPDSTVKKFDTLVLRADYNNSWVHWDNSAITRGQRIRDAWLKDTQRAMGWVSPHSRFVHLFLNGLYWGVYDITERPDAHFAEAYFGGASSDYDVINEFQAKDGKMDAFNALQATRDVSTPAAWEKLQQSLNVTQFVDYLLLNYYAGNQDWGEDKNWYAIRRHTPPGAFHYIVWDGERILENVGDNVISNGEETPFRLVEALKRSGEFRRLFSARVEKHCFGNGALTPAAAAQRWMKRAAEIDQAVIAESARWGYIRRRQPFTRDGDWLPEQERLLKEYFPQRTAIVIRQIKAAGLCAERP